MNLAYVLRRFSHNQTRGISKYVAEIMLFQNQICEVLMCQIDLYNTFATLGSGV